VKRKNISARILLFDFDHPSLTAQLYDYGNETGKPFAIFRDYKDKGNLIRDIENFAARERMNLVFIQIIY
jgi:hypothetical protein